jgi:hypothetical protein
MCPYLAVGGYRAHAAGASWALMTANATWAAREGHTSVIDAAGHIYVLGGGYIACYRGGCRCAFYNDVWRSADQGAARHCCADARMLTR